MPATDDPPGGRTTAERTFDGDWRLTDVDLDATEGFDQTIRPRLDTESIDPGLPRVSLVEGEDQGAHARISQLVVGRLLGEGGVGMVHEAFQPLLNRMVAIKRPRPDARPRAGNSLFREGRTMGGLDHPNIVPVHALGVGEDGRPVLVMKRIAGVSWLLLIEQPTHRGWEWWTGLSDDPLARHVELLIQVCRAAHFAHRRGVLHADLKPQNVMLSEDGAVYVLDWGVARSLDDDGPQPVAGTPVYMAPETVDPDARESAATDVYQLGGCLHHVLAGRAPHQGETMAEVLAAVNRAAPPELPESAPEPLRAICRKALAREPADRFASAAAMADALTGWLRTRGSLELTARADERHEAFHSRLEEEPPDPVRVARAFAETRFGYRQALESWAENAEAAERLRALLLAMIGFELQRDNVDRAAELVEDLDDDDPERSRIEAEISAGKRRRDDLRGLEHAQDLSVARTARTVLLVSFALLLLVLPVGLYLRAQAQGRGLDTLDLVWMGVGINVGLFGAILVSRRWMFANAVNRAIALSIASASAMAFVGRVLGHLAGSSVSHVLAMDLVVLAAAIAAASSYLEAAPLWAGAVVLALGAPAIAAWPHLVIPIYALSTTLVVAAAAVYWWRASKA